MTKAYRWSQLVPACRTFQVGWCCERKLCFLDFQINWQWVTGCLGSYSTFYLILPLLLSLNVLKGEESMVPSNIVLFSNGIVSWILMETFLNRYITLLSPSLNSWPFRRALNRKVYMSNKEKSIINRRLGIDFTLLHF